MSSKPLNPRHLRVVNRYLKGSTRKQAMLDEGYSEIVAHSATSDIFDLPHIKKYIAKRQREMAERNKVTEDWIVQRLMDIADATLGDLLIENEDGSVELDESGKPRLDYSKMNPKLARALQSFDIKTYMEGRGENKTPVTQMKISLTDRLRALEMLGKYLGMWKEKVEVSGDQKVMDALAEARKRVYGE